MLTSLSNNDDGVARSNSNIAAINVDMPNAILFSVFLEMHSGSTASGRYAFPVEIPVS